MESSLKRRTLQWFITTGQFHSSTIFITCYEFLISVLMFQRPLLSFIHKTQSRKMSLGCKLYQLILKSRRYWKLWQRKHCKLCHPTTHFELQFLWNSSWHFLHWNLSILLIYLPALALHYGALYCVAQSCGTRTAILKKNSLVNSSRCLILHVVLYAFGSFLFVCCCYFFPLKWPINGAAYNPAYSS